MSAEPIIAAVLPTPPKASNAVILYKGGLLQKASRFSWGALEEDVSLNQPAGSETPEQQRGVLVDPGSSGLKPIWVRVAVRSPR